MRASTFNSLRRGGRYTFVFGNGVFAITGVFHELRTDGTLLVAGRASGEKELPTSRPADEYVINPDNVVYVRREDS